MPYYSHMAWPIFVNYCTPTHTPPPTWHLLQFTWTKSLYKGHTPAHYFLNSSHICTHVHRHTQKHTHTPVSNINPLHYKFSSSSTDEPPNTRGYRYTHTAKHLHDIYMNMNMKEEHVEMANIEQNQNQGIEKVTPSNKCEYCGVHFYAKTTSCLQVRNCMQLACITFSCDSWIFSTCKAHLEGSQVMHMYMQMCRKCNAICHSRAWHTLQ